jgi:hypothetical protein
MYASRLEAEVNFKNNLVEAVAALPREECSGMLGEALVGFA